MTLLAVPAGAAEGRSAEPPVASQGVLDLRDWDPERDGPVELRGEWRFFWRQLRSPDEGCAGSPADTFASLPSVWTGKTHAGETLPAEGYATYCLRVLLAARSTPLTVLVPRLRTASDLWVNGALVGDGGRVGTSPATSQPRRVDHVAAIAPAEHLDFVLQISNYHFRTGGAHRPVVLGGPVDLEPLAHGTSAALTAFFIGAFVILGLYHLLTQAVRERGGAPGTFGALCLVMAGYVLTRENNLFALLLPWIPWPWEIRLEYTFFGVCVPLAASFIRAIYPSEVPRSLVRACTVCFGLFALAIWTLPSRVTSDRVLLGFQLCFAVLGTWGVSRLALAVLRRRPGANWFVIGGGLWVATGLGDGLIVRFVPTAPRLMPFGFMAVIVAQAVVLAIAQAQSNTRAKELSTRLLSLASEKLALETLAYRDPLTGLENRRRLDEGAEQLRKRQESEASDTGQVSLLYFDVDRFKHFNDTYGHDVGDEILIRIAQILREEFRTYDLSVRLGGDEFAVLLSGVDEQSARAQAARLRKRLEEPLQVGGHSLLVSLSIGIATVDADRVDVAQLLRRADREMYRDKAQRAARSG